MTEKTIHPISTHNADSHGATASPEFVDAKRARDLFGLTRSYLYNLIKAGSIRSCCIRQPGAFRGRRLFSCESIRSFLAANMEGAK